jgi:hypothetical protein
MRPSGQNRMMTVDARTEGAHPLLWFGIMVAAAVLLLLAVVATSSSGLDRLLPNGEPFVPYFTT